MECSRSRLYCTLSVSKSHRYAFLSNLYRSNVTFIYLLHSQNPYAMNSVNYVCHRGDTPASCAEEFDLNHD